MKIFKFVQNILLGISLLILAFVPLWYAFVSDDIFKLQNTLYQISFICVTLVILIRPIADIFIHQKWLRKLVFLRKGFGVLSASIVVAFVIGNIIMPDSQYITSMFTKAYWSFENYVIFAHIGDITGFILLITSNNLSIVLFKKNWKRIQKLAYVYFYAGGFYEALALHNTFALVAISTVSLIIIIDIVFKEIRNQKKVL